MNIPERFLPPPWTAAVVLLCASACINVPAVEPAQAEVRITAPAGTAYTNGVVEVRLDVTGHTPERVELLKDGEVLTELAPPYTYTWDTAGEAEGTYRLEARAALGDLAYVSASREVVVDRTPPQVVSRVPEPGALEIWVQSPIRAEFSEPVKRSTVTTESVHLTVGDVAVAHTVSLSEDGKTVTVVPVTQMTAPSTVALAFSGTVTDLAGNAAVNLGEAWSWAVPEFVPYPTHSRTPPGPYSWTRAYIQLDPYGHPIVMTPVFDGQDHLFVSRWAGNDWEQLGDDLKKSTSDYALHSPNIQIASDGTPVVAWQENLGAEFNNYVHVARWTGQSWERLGREQGILPERPHAWDISLQLTSQDRPLVAINMDPEDPEGGTIHIYQQTENHWQRIGTPVSGPLTSTTGKPTLAVDHLDNPIVVFGHAPPNSQLFTRRWTNNIWESLGSTVNPSSIPRGSGGDSFITFTPDNRPTILWPGRSNASATNDFFSSQWTNNEWVSLGSPPKRSELNHRGIYGARITSQGELITASLENENGEFTLSINRHRGESWEELWNTRDAFNGTRPAIQYPSMAADSHGNIAVAWLEQRGDQRQEVVIYRRNR